MKRFKKILCPYDFSEYAEEALNYAFELADDGTRLTLLHIVQFPYAIDSSGFICYEINAKKMERISEEEALKKVERWRVKYPTLQIELRFVVNNDPAKAIVKTQEEGHYELIVMGSHGKSGFSELPMGSVAEFVQHKGACPVIIIKKGKCF